jgi:hypothetical protein
MAKRETFWTPTRLKELRKLWKTMTLQQLEEHFKRRPGDIVQAHEFQRRHKQLKISITQSKGVRTTIYKAMPCEGAIEPRRYSHDILDL